MQSKRHAEFCMGLTLNRIFELHPRQSNVFSFLLTAKGATVFLTMEQVNFTTTKSKEWAQQCEQWAQARSQFEVRGIESRDFDFCKSFCVQHKYSYKYNMRAEEFIVVFSPLPPKKSAS